MIVVAGYTRPTGSGTSSDFAVARLTLNGSLDTSFSGDGKVGTSISNGDDIVNAVAIQPDGKIVVAGGSWWSFEGGPSFEFSLARYNTNGTLDTSFSGMALRSQS
jgi:uncharacterized delta-60 repeat protein